MPCSNNAGAAKPLLLLSGLAIGAAVIVVTALMLFSSPREDAGLGTEGGAGQAGAADDLLSPRESDASEERDIIRRPGAGPLVPIKGFLSLDRAPLSGVTVQAFSDRDEAISPSMSRLLQASTLAQGEAAEELSELLAAPPQNDEAPAATVETGTDGSFSLTVAATESVTFGLDHDFFFLPQEQGGPFEWAEIGGKAPTPDGYDGRLRAELGGMVRGKVTDPDGLPIADIEVELLQAPGDSERNMGGFPFGGGQLEMGARVTATDGEGEFRLRGVPVGTEFILVARAEGFAPARSDKFEAAPGQVQTVDLELRQGAALGVLVRDPEGRPLADASLVLLKKPDEDVTASMGRFGPFMRMMRTVPVDRAATGPEGRHVFPSLGPGEYTVRAAKSGLLESETEDPLEIPETDQVFEVELDCGWGESIAGRVADEAGRPIAGATILALPHTGGGGMNFNAMRRTMTSGEEAEKSIVSAADGSFRITGLRSGEAFDLHAEAMGYVSAWSRSVKAGADGHEIVLTDPGVIEGRVIAAATGRPVKIFRVAIIPAGEDESSSLRDGMRMFPGARDDGGRVGRGGRGDRGRFNPFQTSSGTTSQFDRVAGTLFDAARESFRNSAQRTVSQTDREDLFRSEDGRFSIGDIVAGRYRLCVSSEGFGPRVTEVLDVEKGASVPELAIALDPGASISGRVVDPLGPVGGAEIELMIPAALSDAEEDEEEWVVLNLALESVDITESDADGGFRLSSLPAGSFTVEARHREHPEGSTDMISLAVGQALSGVVVNLPAGAIVTGSALSEQGFPLPGQFVLCRPSRGWSGMQRERTDDDGRFTFKGLGEGDYSITLMTGRSSFFSRGDRPDSIQVTLVEGEVKEVVLSEPALEGTTVRGLVTDGSRPLDNGFLTVSPSSRGQTRTAVINSDGTYLVEGVKPGSNRFNIRFSDDSGGERVTESFDIPDAVEYVLDIELPAGDISGTVVDAATGAPLAGVRVDLRPVEETDNSFWGRWNTVKSTRTEDDGSFSIRKLAGGVYDLQTEPPRSLAGPHGTGYCDGGIDAIVLDEDGEVSGLKIPLAAGGAIRVIVSDAGGSAVRGALVNAFRSDGGDSGAVTEPRGPSRAAQNRSRTDESGVAVLTGIDPGTYDLSVQAQQMAQVIEDHVAVREGATRNVEITVVEGVEVSVRLSDEAGQPLIGASIDLQDAQGRDIQVPRGRFSANSEDPDADLYRLGKLLPGSYTLEARRQGKTGTTVFSVGGPGEIALTLKME